MADLVDERHRRVPDAAPVERVADLVGVERRRQRPVGRADQDEHARGLAGRLVGDLLAVRVVHRRRPDVDVDDVAGVHHERAGPGRVPQHAVERRRLDDVLALLRDRPDGRARGVRAGLWLTMKPPVRAALDERVRDRSAARGTPRPPIFAGFESATVPPNQNVGPTLDTGSMPSAGSATCQVMSSAECGADETGSSSGSSWPVQSARVVLVPLVARPPTTCARHAAVARPNFRSSPSPRSPSRPARARRPQQSLRRPLRAVRFSSYRLLHHRRVPSASPSPARTLRRPGAESGDAALSDAQPGATAGCNVDASATLTRLAAARKVRGPMREPGRHRQPGLVSIASLGYGQRPCSRVWGACRRARYGSWSRPPAPVPGSAVPGDRRRGRPSGCRRDRRRWAGARGRRPSSPGRRRRRRRLARRGRRADDLPAQRDAARLSHRAARRDDERALSGWSSAARAAS